MADADYLREVEECRRFYASDQWLIWRNGRMIEAHRPKHRVRITINKLIPAVESIRSTFLRVDPTITTEAATDQDSDRKAAEVSKKLLRYYWRTLKMKKKLGEIVLNSCVDGNAWLRSRWDNQAGRKMPKFQAAADLASMAGRVSYRDVEARVPEG